MTSRIEALNAEARRALKEGRAAESLALYGNALRTEPSFEGYQNSALALSHLGHLQEALALSSWLIEGFPDQPLAWFNHAFFLANLDRAEDALPAADRALALAPQFDKAQKLKAECLLSLGRYREGFALHARCYEKVVSRHANLIPRPLWSGAEALRGKRILLHLEPHYGNTIQLLRYAQLAVDAGATVIVEVQPTLKPLLVGSPHIASVNAIGEKLPDFDLHCPFAALPYLFGTTVESVPRGIPYLEPPSAYREKWASIIDRGAQPAATWKIGFCYRGNPIHMRGHYDKRPIPLPLLLGLAAGTPHRWFCLQLDATEAERALMRGMPNITDLGGGIADWADTAAIVAQLDLVVSIDTSLAHLAGALGKPVWVLTPFAPSWQWRSFGHGRAWYPGARVWKQPSPDDWRGVIDEISASGETRATASAADLLRMAPVSRC